jgi:hypothetical protein
MSVNPHTFDSVPSWPGWTSSAVSRTTSAGPQHGFGSRSLVSHWCVPPHRVSRRGRGSQSRGLRARRSRVGSAPDHRSGDRAGRRVPAHSGTDSAGGGPDQHRPAAPGASGLSRTGPRHWWRGSRPGRLARDHQRGHHFASQRRLQGSGPSWGCSCRRSPSAG